MEQFEEYTATDAACDTADLNMHVNFENYTYVQLLSETVSFDRKLQRNLSLLSSSFRLKKKMEEETSLARSKSNVSQLKDVSWKYLLFIEQTCVKADRFEVKLGF